MGIKILWAFGLSIVLGGLVLYCLYKALDCFFKWWEKKNFNKNKKEYPINLSPQNIIFGIVERFAFTILFAVSWDNAIVALVGWLGIKTALGWEKIVGHPGDVIVNVTANVTDETKQAERKKNRFKAFNSLICSLVSMLFAFWGAAVLSGRLEVQIKLIPFKINYEHKIVFKNMEAVNIDVSKCYKAEEVCCFKDNRCQRDDNCDKRRNMYPYLRHHKGKYYRNRE